MSENGATIHARGLGDLVAVDGIDLDVRRGLLGTWIASRRVEKLLLT